MKREIFVVNANVVDANGAFNPLTGYPKTFDSKYYDNDIDRTRQRAYSEYYAALSAMGKVDTRQLQYATIVQVSSAVMIERHMFGALADLPDPEPEAEG